MKVIYTKQYTQGHFYKSRRKKDYKIMIDGRKFFDQPVKIDMKTYENIWKITTGEKDNYTIGCLQYYPFFKKCYNMIDLRKQQAFDFDPKLFYYWRSKRNHFGFFSRNSDRIMNLTCFNIYQYKMTQYNSVNFKLSNSQLKKSKSVIKNGTAVILNLWSNKAVDSNDETNFSPKLLLIDRQVSGLRKTFANNSSANIKLSKTQLSKIV